MKKKFSFADIVALDNALDTMVFGRPLGLFGEKIAEEKKEEKPNPLAELIALDKALDTAVFGKPLGLIGEKATKEDIAKVSEVVAKIADKAETTKTNTSVIARVVEDVKNDKGEYTPKIRMFKLPTENEDMVAKLCGKIATRHDCKPSIIGKEYKVFDNSYATCKTYGTKACGLHGKVYTITSEPYKARVKTILDREEDELMVDVRSKDTGIVYSVLFSESDIMANDKMSYREMADAKRNFPRF